MNIIKSTGGTNKEQRYNFIMSKKTLQGRSQIRGKGKLYGRSSGPLVFNEIVNTKVTPEIDAAIKKNRESK